MPRYVLSLGSSTQDGPNKLHAAVNRLGLQDGLTIAAMSPIYRNLSVGMRYPRFCFNSCLAISTTMSPDSLLLMINNIENTMGRIRTCKNAPRTIDIDIIYSPDITFHKSHLSIPHAELWSRDFFLIPLYEVLEQCHWPKSLTLSKRSYMIKSARRFLSSTH